MNERWHIRRAGPEQAPHRVLMIPGGLCSTEFYADVMAEPALAGQGLVAATMPGFGGTTAWAGSRAWCSMLTSSGTRTIPRGRVVGGHVRGRRLGEVRGQFTFHGPGQQLPHEGPARAAEAGHPAQSVHHRQERRLVGAGEDR
ncbi:hypothetical protein [Streptomyces sp. NPDC048419]|uniref:hypothetical protein n=1 Tax=Streptomyces sp. NPDC048419 TaxID=3365547 RepID=UPI003722D197